MISSSHHSLLTTALGIQWGSTVCSIWFSCSFIDQVFRQSYQMINKRQGAVISAEIATKSEYVLLFYNMKSSFDANVAPLEISLSMIPRMSSARKPPNLRRDKQTSSPLKSQQWPSMSEYALIHLTKPRLLANKETSSPTDHRSVKSSVKVRSVVQKRP